MTSLSSQECEYTVLTPVGESWALWTALLSLLPLLLFHLFLVAHIWAYYWTLLKSVQSYISVLTKNEKPADPVASTLSCMNGLLTSDNVAPNLRRMQGFEPSRDKNRSYEGRSDCRFSLYLALSTWAQCWLVHDSRLPWKIIIALLPGKYLLTTKCPRQRFIQPSEKYQIIRNHSTVDARG